MILSAVGIVRIIYYTKNVDVNIIQTIIALTGFQMD
jgi:hypothetical protein